MSRRSKDALVRLPPEGTAPLAIPCQPSDDPVRDVARAKAIAAGLAARAVSRLGELIESGDTKVSLTACEAIRRWVEPDEARPKQQGSDEMRALSNDDLDAILKSEVVPS